MPKSSKADVRIIPVFRKANLTDSDFLQEIMDRIIVNATAYMAKNDKLPLELKEEEKEEGEIVNVRYVSRSEIVTDDGICSASAEISLC
jgi:hypothetical protein